MHTKKTYSRKSCSLVAVVATLCSACPLDDDRCAENQILVTDPGSLEYCACAPNTIMAAMGYGCTPCGDNEEAQNGQCTCITGYTRLTANAPCEQAVGQEIGESCADDGSCSEPYPDCVTDDTDRYCTKRGCSAGSCPTSYSCQETDDALFCAKLPSGIGAECTATGGECEGFEANFCEIFMTQTCFVAGCATGQSLCPGEYACCDLSSLVGAEQSLCFAPDQLQDGACPVGTLVMP